MIFSSLNSQNIASTCGFLKSLKAASGGKAAFQIILSPVPTGEDELLEKREQ